MIIASFWVLRPEEHPEAAERNYPGMLQVLQRSCDKLGLKHVCLTDSKTAHSDEWPDGVSSWIGDDVPEPLMKAVTDLQLQFLDNDPEDDVMFVGADCIMLKDPDPFYPPELALAVTYRSPKDKHPINSGAIVVRKHSQQEVMRMFRRIAERCGTVWCDDQRALCEELRPLPPQPGIYERRGVKVGFMPMARRNVVPRTVIDSCPNACMVHFRGKARKRFFFEWAKRQGRW